MIKIKFRKGDLKKLKHIGKCTNNFSKITKESIKGPLYTLAKEYERVVLLFTPHDSGRLKRSIKVTNPKFRMNKRKGFTAEIETGFRAKHATKLEHGLKRSQVESWAESKAGLTQWVRRHLQTTKEKRSKKKTSRGNNRSKQAAKQTAYFIWRKQKKEGFKVPLEGPGKNFGKGEMLQRGWEGKKKYIEKRLRNMRKIMIDHFFKACKDGGQVK